MENTNTTGNGSVENEESDSGDSLFITQKPVPHPVISSISPHLSLRSSPLSHRTLESTSSSESDPENVPEKAKKPKYCLPEYNFPFLKSKDGSLNTSRNRAIHYSGMAGFFKCVDEMWQSGNRRQSFESTLPTVDSENDEITPITEDEKSDEEDVKIIDKRLFVYSVKPIITKSSQPWFSHLKKNMSQSTQANKAAPQMHFGTKKKSQSESSNSKCLSDKQQQHLDSSDSDATLIDEYELSTSRSKNESKAKDNINAPESTMNSPEVQPISKQGKELPSSEEFDNTESQSILQYSTVDIRGSSQNNVCNENGLNQSTKKRRKIKMMDGQNDNLYTSLSQESLHNMECDLETTQVSEPMSLTEREVNGQSLCEDINFDTESEVNGQSLCEDTGQQSCPNVDINNDDAPVQKKKKKHKKKTTENTEKANHSLNLDPLQMLNNGQTDDIASVENEVSDVSNCKRSKTKKKQNSDRGDCNDDEDVALRQLQLKNTDKNILSEFVDSRGNSELVDNSATDCTVTQSDESVSVKKKKRKNKESTEKLHDGECDLKSTPLTEPIPCPNVEDLNDDDATVQKKKKKKHKKKTTVLENVENGTNSSNLAPVEMLQTDYINAVDKVESEKSDGKSKKLKKKRKADPGDVNDEQDVTLKKLQQNRTDKNILSEFVDSRGKSELVDNSATDCTVTQSDESVSVKKKKRKNKESSGKVHDGECDLKSTPVTEPISCPNVEDLNDDDATVQKKKKKKHKKKPADLENAENGTNSSNLAPVEMLQTDYFSAVDKVESEKSDGKSKKLKKKRKADADLNDEQDVTLKKLQQNRTDKNILSEFVESRGKSELVDNGATDCTVTQSDESVSVRKKKRKNKESSGKLHDGECDLKSPPLTEPISGPNVEDLNDDEATVQKKKKKKHKKKTADLENAENGTNSSNLAPVEMLQTAVDKMESEKSDGKSKKHKKKRKADPGDLNEEQVVTLKKLQQNRTDKNILSKLVECQEKFELVNHDNSATATQSDESVSVRKRKKKRKVSAAETVENANFPLSPSTQSHGEDELAISTNYLESAETNRLLQDTELGTKIKKKKKKSKKDELDSLRSNGKTSEDTEMSRCNDGKDSSELAQPHGGDGDHVKKKKKKKKSKHESHQYDIEMTTQRQISEVEESAIISPKASKKKKKKCSDNGEGGVEDTVMETELQQIPRKREKLKENRIEDVDQISLSHGKMSTSSGRLETSSRTKVKKRLYHPSSQAFLGEF